MKYRLRIYGDPVLRRKAEEIVRIDAATRALADGMLRVMGEKKGVGLAAQQIGQIERICVVDVPACADMAEPNGPRLNPDVVFPLIMINPVIRARRGSMLDKEGCLSVPEIWAPVSRAAEIEAEYLDLEGRMQAILARGMLARAIQHELDHLDGVLFVDRVSTVKKVVLTGKLRRLRERGEAEAGS